MSAVNLKGRDLICTQDWSIDELEAMLELGGRDEGATATATSTRGFSSTRRS